MAATPPAKRSRGKRRRVCLEVTNTITADDGSPALFLSQDCSVPIQTPLSSAGCNLWLQQPAIRQCLNSTLLLVTAPSLLLQQLGLSVGSCSSPLPCGCSMGLSLPGQKSLLCHRKAKAALSKLLYLKPDQLLYMPQKPAQGGQNPNKRESVCATILASANSPYTGEHDISRSVLSTLNPPTGPCPNFIPPQRKHLATAQRCWGFGVGKPSGTQH